MRMKLSIFCGLLALSSGWTSDAQAAGHAAEIQKTSTAPTMDGLGTDAVWAGATPHTTSEFLLSGNSNPSGAADLSITWKALWDDTNLYVFVEVTDDAIGPGSSGAPNFWQDDSIEIFIDAQDTNSTDYLQTSNPAPPNGVPAFQFTALAGDATGDGNYPTHVAPFVTGVNSSPFALGVNSYVTDDADTQYVQESDTGFTLITGLNTYTLEVAFPWTALQETPANIQANGGFGFGISVNDDDNDDNARDTQLTWMTSAGTLFMNASLFPTVTLVGLDGDFDGDDDIDGNDFLKWQRDLGDAASLAEWEANFGIGAGPLAAGVGAVPEPSTMALLGFAVAATAIMARRRSKFGSAYTM